MNPRHLLRSRLGAALSAGLVTAVGVIGLIGGSAIPAHASNTKLPFTDPAINGYIGLCDLAGNNVTSGSINSKPFVWKAVGSTAAPKAYIGKGQQAGLFIYQPRPDVIPGEWSGDEMTASTVYRNSKLPTAVATYKDFSMANFIKEFPSQVDGLYELRMHVGKTNYGTYSATYPATFIQVTGDQWHVVQGGTVACKSAIGTSTEARVGIPQVDPTHNANETPVTAPPSSQPSGGSSPTAGSSAPPSTPGGTSSDGQTITEPIAGDAASSAATTTSTSPVVVVLAVVSGVLLVTLIVGYVRRRRQDRQAT